ncbi:YqiA/YcfP family alpha/beta fold hydrolase [Biformimicrobium ophioploci]|uniref:Esterase YqiA n=1 Tax=Biformimicrobium ophioploci TaxID=3036711 RepID=A0ABQ6M0M4_9GAMM|nr:YqiA/YcfP family alpha/beta fold hydrolase [Microbulbifer sp. NKW57]GMG87896.1 esterase YqiA [Microbulbifer sp. NKW57]
MQNLVYCHGFLSSPASFKCQLLKRYCADTLPALHYLTPDISPHPQIAADTLSALVEPLLDRGEAVGLVGSSMGGFWCTWLAERYGLRAVLINPAVHPARRMAAYLGQPLKGYHDEREYRLGEADRDTMAALEPKLPLRGTYWLLAQTGDEVLDYREAEAFYAGQRADIEPGGDHGFQGFERFCGEITRFLFAE